MTKYSLGSKFRRRRRRILLIIFLLVIIVGAAAVLFYDNLQPVSSSREKRNITIASGLGVNAIALELQKDGLIRNSQAFEWYINIHFQRNELQAGTYSFSPSESTSTIAEAIVNGRVATNLVTILSGQTLAQISQTFIKAGFNPIVVSNFLNASSYSSNSYPILANNPASASLEGFLWPDSYQKTSTTSPGKIVAESLSEMEQHVTLQIRTKFAGEGLDVYQGVTLASIVEQEVADQTDRNQVAQVFLKRLQIGMPLGSDVTAYYGSTLVGIKPSLTYDSPYNTLLHTGLPPGPISTVSSSSLEAVANPANTDWLYFVTGDNGTTYFAQTSQQQNANISTYCHQLCSQD
ncbi:MAG: endolytic transglycosylase MltG [Candidatus Saccharimonadales bacterium]